MKIKLPIIGQVQTGKDADSSLPINVISEPVKTSPNPKNKSTFYDLLGGVLESPYTNSEKSISAKILQANKEWTYKNNDVIAKEVSKINFELYSVGLKSGEINYKEIEEHPLLDFLDQVNSFTTKADAFYITQSHKKLTGDSFWLLHRNGQAITGASILQPDKIELDLGDPTSEDRIIKGYKYVDQVDGKRVEEYYDYEDILHFKTPNPQNPFRGCGVVESMADTIDLDNLTNDLSKQFFNNGAISNFVLSTEGKVTDSQLKRIKAEFRSAYQGIKNAFKVIILGGGLKPVVISPSNKDVQFMEQLAWYRDKIMVGFGNTKASLGIVDDVNRSSYDGSYYGWLKTTVKPDMDAILNTLNEFLVPLFGDNLVLGYTDPVPEDRTDDINEAVQLKQAGIISQNEARSILDYQEVKGGDDFNSDSPVLPEDQQRIYRHPRKDNKTPASLRHMDIKKVLRRQKAFTKRRLNKELAKKVKPLARKLINSKNKTKPIVQKHVGFTNEQVTSYYQKQNNVIDIMSDKFEKAVQGFIGKIEKEVLENLDVEVSDKDLKNVVKKQLFDKEALRVTAQLDFGPILLQEATLAGLEAYKIIGKDDPYIPFKLTDVIRDNVAKFAESMLDTDQDDMTRIIQAGIEEGKSVPEIRDDITSKFDDIKTTQSAVITRTEVLRTSTLATEDAFIQSGVVEAKEWLTASDPDEQCAQYAGKVVKLNGNFYKFTDEFQDGNPPLHPNCRCVLIPVLSE